MRIPEISECLAKQTKDELMVTAMRLGLPPIGTRAKKAEWIAHIAENLTTHMLNVRMQMRLSEIDAVNEQLKKSMSFAANMLDDDDGGLLPAMGTLQRYGLSWWQDERWYIRDSVAEMLKMDESDRAEQDMFDILTDVMDGWLLHVGMMPLEELLERTAAILELPEDQQEIGYALCEALLIARRGPETLYTDAADREWAVDLGVDDPEKLLKRLNEPGIAALDYPEFNEDELAYAATKSFLPGNIRLYLPLLNWLEEHDCEDADGLIEDAIYLAQNDRVNDAVRMILDEVEPKDEAELNQFVGMIYDLFNKIPRWSNKGHSPESLFRVMTKPQKAAKMPGRNDPCTCGSGKKYKQCCGRRIQ